jgi:methionyl-tRNA formyltransferase
MSLKNIYKIIFIGTPEFSVPTLKTLIADERFDVVAVITAPDAPVGRRQILTPPPVKVAAEKYGLKILQPVSLKKFPLSQLGEGSGVRADVIITIAYGQIIPVEILNFPKFGCLNLHASLLPKYRGASPIQAAIANGDTETGVTLMQMNKGLDTGPVIVQEKIGITADETGESLHEKLAKLSAKTLLKYLPDYLAGKITPRPQDNAQATFAPKLTRASGRVDWTKPAAEIERTVRAYYPWPGTWSLLNGKTLKIIKVSLEILNVNKYQAGEIFKHNNGLAVQCGKGALALETVQLEGKRPMSGAEFLRGNGGIVGATLHAVSPISPTQSRAARR